MTIEQHLDRLGVPAPSLLQDLEELLNPVKKQYAFIDPRDENGEVPY